MKFAFLSMFVLASLLLSNGVDAASSPPMLFMSTPGEALQIDIPENAPAPPIRLKKTWYSVSLDGPNLVLERSVATRRPDWNLITRKTGTLAPASTVTPKSSEPTRHAISMANTAFLAFRLDRLDIDEKFAEFKSGRYPSSLSLPAILHDRWKSSFQSNGQIWTVSTESSRRKDGAMLAGSLELVATNGAQERRVLVPPAHGMAFERQELLWLGSLRPNSEFDLLLKRTWVTGEIDYVLKIGDSLGYAKFDPDYPHMYFSQGIEEYEVIETHISQKRLPPDGKFGVGALTISEETWNQAVAAAKADELPKVLFDRQLAPKSEKIRITVEYLPRLEPKESALSSSQFFWEGPVLIKVHFRGKSQILLQTGSLDGGSFRLQVDMLGDEPAIEISLSPHYNNSFVHYWVWDGIEGRFLRLSRAQSQGC